MQLLRITQSTVGTNRYRAEVRFEDGRVPIVANTEFGFTVTAQDHEDLRWYLEDYLQFPQDPAGVIASRIEQRMTDIGTGLFQAIFHANDDARDLWARIRHKISDTRIEVDTTVEEASTVPWELMRDPSTDATLALRSLAFVRIHPRAAQRPWVPAAAEDPIRILLVICRPGGWQDVPFRSVAARLVKCLDRDARSRYQLDVLRPPTFEHLGRVLRHAKAVGVPYHVVHFDGHGMYADATDTGTASQLALRQRSCTFGTLRRGKHGYVLFEDPDGDANTQLIDGPTLGRLLTETNVPVLVLNACQSAHAAPPPEPMNTGEQPRDLHSEIRTYGSLAQEVVDMGVAGVVAMRYSVYVVTAAQFVANLYSAFAQGRTLGEAVTLSRKQLADQPSREIAFERRPLQDWCVPIVYEAIPVTLFTRNESGSELPALLDATSWADNRDGLDEALPKPPDFGFFGRDETLLAIDRALDKCSVVLLHAYAGSGKTSVAAEFARWYAMTGGVSKVLFSTFQCHMPLSRLLDQIGRAFASDLEKKGIRWLTLEEDQQRKLALELLRMTPILWIWDNVEPIAGFPAGTESSWSEEEQRELADFLRDAQDTRAKFLLTSRRDELGWLGDLPRRIAVPAMPMPDRVQLARAIAERHGQRLPNVDKWLPLLQFTEGNPLTVTILVSQALRDGLCTKEECGHYVDAIREGEIHFTDEITEGRSRSLCASLNYAFEHAFSSQERQQLAALCLFQEGVGTDILRLMGNEDMPWCVDEMRRLSEDHWIALLNRAAEIGLLERVGHGSYTIHPAVPWFLRQRLSVNQATAIRLERAFAESIGYLGAWISDQYGEGKRDDLHLGILIANEENFRRGYSLARQHSLFSAICGITLALSTLHIHTGRRREWHKLLKECSTHFSDSDPRMSVPDQTPWKLCWREVAAQRGVAAGHIRDFAEAERITSRLVADIEEEVQAFASSPVTELTHFQRLMLGQFARALVRLGEYQSLQDKSESVASLTKAYEIAMRIGDTDRARFAAYYLGIAYHHTESIENLDKAEYWYRDSMRLQGQTNPHEYAKCLHQLATVAFERFQKAWDAGADARMRSFEFLNQGIGFINQAFELTPRDAVDDLARMHCTAGLLCGAAGRLPRARSQYSKSIALDERQGNIYWAAKTRECFAKDLAREGKREESLQWARSAMEGYKKCGASAKQAIESIEELIQFLTASVVSDSHSVQGVSE